MPLTRSFHDTIVARLNRDPAFATAMLTEAIETTPGTCPCDTCPAPCLTACPVGALGPQPYDVPKCKAFLDTGAGSGCMEAGCLVRRACPVGHSSRQPAQLAFHMKAFNPI